MRLLCAALLLLAFPGHVRRQDAVPDASGATAASGGGGGPAVVNAISQALGVNGGTTGAVNMSGANLCVAVVSALPSTATLSSSPSNTWTAGPIGSSGVATALFYVYSPSVSSTMTFTVTGGGSFPSVQAACFSGTVGSAIDKNNDAIAGAVTSIQAGNVTPGSNHEIVVMGAAVNAGASQPTGFSINSGFTLIASLAGSGSNFGMGTGYLIQTTAAAANPTVSWTNVGAAATAVIGTFQ
jgi:hypothetical protein